MSRPSLADLRQRYKDQKAKKDKKGFGNSNIYPFWAMGMDEQAVVRILPDANEDNPNAFYVDKLEHILSINGKDRNIPCLKMYGERCPICDISNAYYKEKDEINGKKYYRKKTSLARVLVMDDPLPPDTETGEKYTGKVKNTQFSYQIMEKITEQISDDSDEGLEHIPWDMEMGYDFIIKKTPQGKHGTYAIGSRFKKNATPIPADVRGKIELIDLKTLLPANPGLEKVEALLSAHMTGSDDPDAEADEDAGESEAPKTSMESLPKPPAAKVEPAVVAKAKVAEAVEESSDSGDDDEDDLVARIRNRNK